jgi:hypothetical protein
MELPSLRTQRVPPLVPPEGENRPPLKPPPFRGGVGLYSGLLRAIALAMTKHLSIIMLSLPEQQW